MEKKEPPPRFELGTFTSSEGFTKVTLYLLSHGGLVESASPACHAAGAEKVLHRLVAADLHLVGEPTAYITPESFF